MKVEGTEGKHPVQISKVYQEQWAVGLTTEEKNKAAEAKRVKEELSLSPEAAALRRFVQEAKEAEIRAELVAPLQEKIAAGTYKISTQEIAKKIRAEMKGEER